MKLSFKGILSDNPSPTDIVHLLLNNRSVTDESAFLSPPHPTTKSLSDFGFSKEYILEAMEFVWSKHPLNPLNKTPTKPLVVYTDYDADGISGGAALWETLHKLGFSVFPYTPDRITEGYGFSQQGLERVQKMYNPSLILSVEHGIVAKKQVAYAKDTLGIDIIVTDHHHKQDDQVPFDAKAIFHIPTLSGSSTAYYVAKEIAHTIELVHNDSWVKMQKKKNEDVQNLFNGEYVGIACIGTIVDLVPLIGTSRAIAYYGLKALTLTTRPGLVALKQVADHIHKKVTSFEVGFLLAPRINASGRLDDALDAMRLLCTQDPIKATNLARKLDTLNRTRQDMVKKAADDAIQIVESKKDAGGRLPNILFVYKNAQTDVSLDQTEPNSWHEGIIGLIASKLCDIYYRPVIVLTETEGVGDRIYKASCRSIPGFHTTNFLEQHHELLLKFGGHEAAAGFSITQSHLDKFIQQSLKYAQEHVSQEMLERTIEADCMLPLSSATIELSHLIDSLEPFGVGNPKPVFASDGRITDVVLMGKEKQHVRFNLVNQKDILELVAFNKANLLRTINTQEQTYRVVYSLSINSWNGSERIQAKMVTIEQIK